MDQLYSLYRIRWQVELVFKVWKSVLGMHKIRTRKSSRVYCEIYGKLILSVFISMMSVSDSVGIYGERVFSMHRVARQFVVVAMNWASAIMDGSVTHMKFLEKIGERNFKLCCKKRQKNKPTIEYILLQTLPNCEIMGNTSNARLA